LSTITDGVNAARSATTTTAPAITAITAFRLTRGSSQVFLNAS
jgi:hypothetical protein